MNYLSICEGFFFLFFVQTIARAPPSRRRNLMTSSIPLSCTPSCRELRDTKNTPDVVCSCSSSCLIYGDCCHDAPFKNTGDERKNLGCLTLSGLGPVSVVNSCPTSTGVLAEACREGLGASVPVTSKDTGTSYSNYYCALCNRDSFNVIDWPVEFRCCNQNSKIVDQTIKEYVEYDNERDILWAVSELKNGSRVFCECKFYARNDDVSFAASLELRECKREEISSCSHTWDVRSTRKLCSAYVDPIYSGEKIYRNRHCAACNYENPQRLKCSDEPANPLLMSPARLFAYCKSQNIPNCVSYLRAKGHHISFYDIFRINQRQCIPPEGRLCCGGKRFDHRLQKCSNVPARIVLFSKSPSTSNRNFFV